MNTSVHTATCHQTVSPVRKTGVLARLAAFMGIARQRRALMHLNDDLLRDIGITREQAIHEARKAPWDVPHHWIN